MSLLGAIFNTLRGTAMTKTYLSKDGKFRFKFFFEPANGHITVRCLSHPPLGARDPSPLLTHLFPSGRLCFVEGHEPRDQARAEALAKQWAEYFLEYRRTGIPQS